MSRDLSEYLTTQIIERFIEEVNNICSVSLFEGNKEICRKPITMEVRPTKTSVTVISSSFTFDENLINYKSVLKWLDHEDNPIFECKEHYKIKNVCCLENTDILFDFCIN